MRGMSEEDLLNLISTGEDSFTEFKSENVHSDSLAKEIVAFANTNGGSIYIGIEDDGEVSGYSDSKLEERAINICRNNIQPSLMTSIEKIKFKDKILLKIFIEKGINKT
jgi:ATP-dependent DNA helicase RecG